jgi:hypothetical protein
MLSVSVSASAGWRSALASSASFCDGDRALQQRIGRMDVQVHESGGKMWSTRASGKGWTMMTKSARAVPKGTVFFMNNGQLYMARTGMFDRAGNFMAGGV